MNQNRLSSRGKEQGYVCSFYHPGMLFSTMESCRLFCQYKHADHEVSFVSFQGSGRDSALPLSTEVNLITIENTGGMHRRHHEHRF